MAKKRSGKQVVTRKRVISMMPEGVVPEGPLVALALDANECRYSVNGGPWQAYAMDAQNALRIERCMLSRQSGHRDHCHLHVWDGRRWIDMGHEFECECP